MNEFKSIKTGKNEIIDDIKQRRGFIKVSYAFIEQSFELYKKLLKDITPILIIPQDEEVLFIEGFSKEFDKISAEEETPLYHINYDIWRKKFVFSRIDIYEFKKKG